MHIQFREIKYKNSVVDTGVFLGSRKYRWLLKSQYLPCYAQSYGRFINKTTDHKRNFEVYIPKEELKQYSRIKVRNSNKLEEWFITDVSITGVDVSIRTLKTFMSVKINEVENEVEEII